MKQCIMLRGRWRHALAESKYQEGFVLCCFWWENALISDFTVLGFENPISKTIAALRGFVPNKARVLPVFVARLQKRSPAIKWWSTSTSDGESQWRFSGMVNERLSENANCRDMITKIKGWCWWNQVGLPDVSHSSTLHVGFKALRRSTRIHENPPLLNVSAHTVSQLV